MSGETVAPMTTSVLTCPECGTEHTETMPCDACVYFYECTTCGAVLRPKPGDCCVFCSYGSLPCPPIQLARAGLSMRFGFQIQCHVMRLGSTERLPARNGKDFPLTEEEMHWHLGLFGVSLGPQK